MLASVRSPRRLIAQVPYATVANTALPLIPENVMVLGQRGTRRDPTVPELESLTWFVEFDGNTVSAVAAVSDRFDWHACADASEIVHVAGSKRGIAEILRFLIGRAAANGRFTIGSFDLLNKPAKALAFRLGATLERVTYCIGGK